MTNETILPELIGTLAELPEHTQKTILAYGGACYRTALQSPEIQALRKDVERMRDALKEAAAELNCLGSELEDIYSENPTIVTTLPDPNVLSMIRSAMEQKK